MDVKQIQREIIKNSLLDATNKLKNPYKIREFYWNCIDSSGYSLKTKPRTASTTSGDADSEEEALFNYMMNKPSNESLKRMCESCGSMVESGEICRKCLMFLPQTSYQSWSDIQTSSMTQQNTFARTFIGPTDEDAEDKFKRMRQLQQWSTVTAEEQRMYKEIELIDVILSSIQVDSESIRRMAINMMYNINEYYKSNVFNMKINKGSLRKGYIVLSVYYSLMASGKHYSLSTLSTPIQASIADLPEARKNIKLIFSKSPEYSLIINESGDNTLCGLAQTLPGELIQLVNKIKIHTGLGTKPAEIAAIVYYSSQLTKYKELNLKKISEKCKVSIPSINNVRNAIQLFYNKNPGLKAELFLI